MCAVFRMNATKDMRKYPRVHPVGIKRCLLHRHIVRQFVARNFPNSLAESWPSFSFDPVLWPTHHLTDSGALAVSRDWVSHVSSPANIPADAEPSPAEFVVPPSAVFFFNEHAENAIENLPQITACILTPRAECLPHAL